MKYCQKCGKEIVDEAVVCTGCGCSVEVNVKKNADGGEDGLAVAAKVFLILGCVTQAWLLLPLAWCLPITIAICNRTRMNQPVGTGLKVCALLFVNFIAGILLFCRSDDI